MPTIRASYEIPAPCEQVYRALTDEAAVTAWSGGPAKMQARPGGRFSLWDESVHGTNVELVPGRKLVQRWIINDWDPASTVTFSLVASGAGTRLDLVHEGVPEAEVDDITQGWQDYYVAPITEYLQAGNG